MYLRKLRCLFVFYTPSTFRREFEIAEFVSFASLYLCILFIRFSCWMQTHPIKFSCLFIFCQTSKLCKLSFVRHCSHFGQRMAIRLATSIPNRSLLSSKGCLSAVQASAKGGKRKMEKL